jgi:hypothetical protein
LGEVRGHPPGIVGARRGLTTAKCGGRRENGRLQQVKTLGQRNAFDPALVARGYLRVAHIVVFLLIIFYLMMIFFVEEEHLLYLGISLVQGPKRKLQFAQ